MMFRSSGTFLSTFFKGLCNHSDGDHFSNYGNSNILTCEVIVIGPSGVQFV